MSCYQIIECQQGSPEWHRARVGVITASMFAECRKVVGGLTAQQKIYCDAILAGKSGAEALALAEYKKDPTADVVRRFLAGERVGDYTNEAKKYAFRLAIERISGELLSEDKFETWEMRRGRELEPEARLAHEQAKGILVEQVGFVKTDDGLFGASADGFIEEDRGAEYKAFVSPDSLMPILLNGDISDCTDQIQGGMWITGRKAWDFVLYCPALKKVDKDLTVFNVARDDNYIEKLEKDLLEFNRLVESYKIKLEAKS
jgi:hypothetical protein